MMRCVILYIMIFIYIYMYAASNPCILCAYKKDGSRQQIRTVTLIGRRHLQVPNLYPSLCRDFGELQVHQCDQHIALEMNLDEDWAANFVPFNSWIFLSNSAVNPSFLQKCPVGMGSGRWIETCSYIFVSICPLFRQFQGKCDRPIIEVIDAWTWRGFPRCSWTSFKPSSQQVIL